MERHELSALAACIYAKEQLIARKFKNQTRLPQATNLLANWSLLYNQFSLLITGKVLTEMERHELSALAACIYAKEQLIARQFKNQTRLPQATNLPTNWSLLT